MIKGVYISEAASLAIHSMAYISMNSGIKLNVKQIADYLNASESHLSKVMQRLSKAQLVRSIRGPKGGFYLAKTTSEITLYDIYKVVEGELGSETCILKKEGKCKFEKCVFGGIFDNVSESMKAYLSSVTLDKFVN